ncbi:MAG: hypothetical protein OEY37_02960 [Gammaproteobacteria bacterium]|nr:hypothetical protein [Gammaproteobacteria bacterium]MDH5619799.1 hypothetical protein [Gammaproteobacteria bacterium]
MRLLPVLLLVTAAGFWFVEVQQGGPWAARNLVPLVVLVLLSLLTLYKGAGRWSGAGMRMPLGTLGFAIPALGLSAYLHYAYSINLNDMFSDAEYPDRVFRFLPAYTLVAGGIGYAIGWIVGRNV